MFKVFDATTELATVKTDPFELRITGEVSEGSPLRDFLNTQDIQMMQGESVDGDLALHEDWVDANTEWLQHQLATIVEINDLNTVESSELNSGT
jgi:hypothetical protein